MNKEEAIRIFRKEIECLSHAKCEDCILEKVCDPAKTTPLDSEYIEAYGMAIQALSQEPCDDATLKDIFCMGCEYREQEPCDDVVSREAVIMECIKYADHEYNVQFKKEVSETRKHDAQVIIYACDYFKTFVEKLPSVTQNPIDCDDAISRQAYADWLDWLCRLRSEINSGMDMARVPQGHRDKYIDVLTEVIDNLPSVTHKSGKWIEHPEIETTTPEYLMFYECSECGDKPCFCKSDIHKKRFCSNCGAKMKSEE